MRRVMQQGSEAARQLLLRTGEVRRNKGAEHGKEERDRRDHIHARHRRPARRTPFVGKAMDLAKVRIDERERGVDANIQVRRECGTNRTDETTACNTANYQRATMNAPVLEKEAHEAVALALTRRRRLSLSLSLGAQLRRRRRGGERGR